MSGLHFTYRQEPLEKELYQGDVLSRTPELEDVLREVHPHYFRRTSNSHFLVLTQSCDLVRRGGKPCDARYISIAPVRPLAVLTERQIQRFQIPSLSDESPVCSERDRNRFHQFLERLFNNNEAEFFFLRRAVDRGLGEDSCAFLALSIAIKSELHYDTCVRAKVLELGDSFRAKLGWLVGQMYSRVGTEDWTPSTLQREIDEILRGAAIWVPEKELKVLRRDADDWRAANHAKPMTIGVIRQLLEDQPRVRDQVVDRVMKLLRDYFSEAFVANPRLEVKLESRMKSDEQINKLVP